MALLGLVHGVGSGSARRREHRVDLVAGGHVALVHALTVAQGADTGVQTAAMRSSSEWEAREKVAR